MDKSLADLYSAWRAFRRGKRSCAAIDEFEYNVEHQLYELHREIAERTYRHGLYQKIVVQEKKRRELAVALVRDRVVHRLLYDELMCIFDHTFDPDVWSCRRGKGLYGCLARVQQCIRKYPSAYVWRMDITKFFDVVDHATLHDCLVRRISNQQIVWLSGEVIRSYHTSGRTTGIPIGNLTSQIFANIYLNEFDRYVRHTLKPLAYVRYGDDTMLWYRTRRQAEVARHQACSYLAARLNLMVNPKNDVIVSASAGLHFLGHVITGSYVVVDRHTTRLVLSKSTAQSIASYKALLLASIPRQQLDWQLADEIDTMHQTID